MNDNVSIADRRTTLDGGGELAYYDSAPGKGADGPVVVLLHGYCGSSAYWERVVPFLKDTARVIAPDLRGHGFSSAPQEEPYTIDRYADDLAGMLEKAETGNIYLLGHSLGGYIALSFLERYADKLAGFGLIHSTPMPDGEEAKKNRDGAAAAIRKDGVAAFVDGLVPKLFAPQNKEAMAEAVDRAKAIGYGTSEEGAVQAAMAMKKRPDRTGTLQAADLPVLLVAGESDVVVPAEKTFLKEGPSVAQAKLAGAGHMGMYERAGTLAEIIRTFIGS